MAEVPIPGAFICAIYGGEMIQKCRLRLIVTGLGMVASGGGAAIFPLFWLAAMVHVPTGLYLLAWATLGKARWCRTCKKFGAI